MKLGDVFLGCVAILIGAAVFADTLSFPKMPDGTPGPSLFPQILSALFVLFGAILVIQSRRPHTGEAVQYERSAVLKAGLVLVAIAFYVAVVHRLGFAITATVLMAVLMLLLGVRKWLVLPAAVVTVIACVLLFERVLRVPLPPGILGV